jgi:hypothetical protein
MLQHLADNGVPFCQLRHNVDFTLLLSSSGGGRSAIPMFKVHDT